ncbi:N-acetyltransferase [Phytoactinopolyspora alkaliphila]|uniref:N-acetyltransferase n=1 Tax=Phytoactinopolyspora alkaliphila TaxID=1783498 RepID=A0A6N9YMF8_9ACTN|nr:N-acetyltransferase [Phytoactinopolyspora alkaliphila]NED96127.1 N-acetyltransferase [Phytoactinopolyspora alkaliphila]
MLIRREAPADVDAVRAVHLEAFAKPDHPGDVPVEAGLVDDLRADSGWIPALSLVAEADDDVIGHVVCTRGRIGDAPALGLGPLGVLPAHQSQRVGSALMHAVLGAADALDEPVVMLLGHTGYYPRFGFRPASEYGIVPPVPEWGAHFQVRTLSAYEPTMRGEFQYAAPFNDLG